MAVKIDRISARVRPSVKEMMQQAAVLTGSTLNQFLPLKTLYKAFLGKRMNARRA